MAVLLPLRRCHYHLILWLVPTVVNIHSVAFLYYPVAMSLFPSDTDDDVKQLKGASLDEVINSRECIIFSTPACGWCIKAKRFLTEDLMGMLMLTPIMSIISSPILARELINTTGMKTVPNIYIKGRHVGGYEELLKTYRRCRSGDLEEDDEPICNYMARGHDGVMKASE